jgi:hemoglobin
MELTISQYFPGVRPGVTLPSKQMYELLGEKGMRQMVSDHYDLVVQSPVKDLFPKNPIALEKAKEHSADFFIQICGGPDYFNQNRGRPQLNRRHRPFKITADARIEWLKCYQQVLPKIDLPEDVKLSFWNYLDVFSKWMVNS